MPLSLFSTDVRQPHNSLSLELTEFFVLGVFGPSILRPLTDYLLDISETLSLKLLLVLVGSIEWSPNRSGAFKQLSYPFLCL